MIIELNLSDKFSCLAGLDFCLSALAMEQDVNLILSNHSPKHAIEDAIEKKLELAKQLGLEKLFIQPLTRKALRDLYSENEKVLCF